MPPLSGTHMTLLRLRSLVLTAGIFLAAVIIVIAQRLLPAALFLGHVITGISLPKPSQPPATPAPALLPPAPAITPLAPSAADLQALQRLTCAELRDLIGTKRRLSKAALVQLAAQQLT